jgi:hypothetical protein
MEPIRPIGPPEPGPAQVPAIRRLTFEERQAAAREREKRRRERARKGLPGAPGEPPREEGGGRVDFRA